MRVDLNAGAGGDTPYIWIYYKSGPDDGSAGSCITGLYTVDTSNGETDPAEGTVIDVDLNRGAGGDYIYLGYFMQSGADPIRSIPVKNDSATV